MPKTLLSHQLAPKAAAGLLVRIHTLADRIDGGGGLRDRATIVFLAKHLKAGEVCLARHVLDLLRASAAYSLDQCGYVDTWDAELLGALKDFAHAGGWAFEDGGWRRIGAPRALEVAAHG
jgi:hypothetical protein